MSDTEPNDPPGAVSHECQACDSSFGSAGSLRHHRYARHSTFSFSFLDKEYVVAPDQCGYACPFDNCSQSYRNRDGLQRHLRKRHGVESSNGAARVLEPSTPFSHAAVEGVPSGPCQATETRGLSDGQSRLGSVTRSGGVVHTKRAATECGETDAVLTDDQGDNGRPHVALVPGKGYLETSTALDDLGLWLHSGLQVLICRRCKVALSSKMAVGHLKNQHGLDVSKARKVELENLCAQNMVYENSHEVRLPKAGGPPVEGIAPPDAGLSCTAGGDCRYSVRDLQTMVRHGRENHGGGGTVATTKYRASKVQVLFLGVGHVYFEVDSELSVSSDVDARDYLRAAFLPEAGFDEVIAADGSRDRPPLLNVTQWDEFMPEVRENVDQRRAARALKGKHTADEQEGIFNALQRAVLSHHQTTREELDRSTNSFLLRKVLMNGSNFSAAQSKWYFTMLSNDDNNYTRLFLQMVRAMIRARQGHPCRLTFEYTETQGMRLDSLIECLKGGVQRPDLFQPATAQRAYQTFCWSLVHNPGPETRSRWADPIERFVWLLALGDDGTFMQASDLTPVLAKLSYFCRLTALHEALIFTDGESPREGMIERVGRYHSLALRIDRLSTFTTISELQQFATALAHSQIKEPKVSVDPNFKWIKIKTRTLYLDALRGGIQELIKQVKDSFVALSGDPTWLVPSQTSHIEDDIENVQRGYCFLEESPYREARYSFFLATVERFRLGTFVRTQEWTWDMAAIRSFLDRADEVWGHVMHLLYVGLHLSTRVTQFLRFQFRNADRPRNLVFQGTEGISITRYSKTTNAKGADACIPAFLSAPLRDILLVLLGSGFREAQAILAGIVYGSEARWAYRTYLCVERGKRIAQDSFYEVLRKRNEKFFRCAWGASDFRQGMVTLGHEFISPNETFACADDALAEAADHTTEIDVNHYANVHGAFPRVSNNTLCRQRWLSGEWSSLLGLGPHPPPDPVRIRRRNFGEKPTMDTAEPGTELIKTISTAVADMVIHKFESMGLTVDLLKKLVTAAEAHPLPDASPPSRPPIHARALSMINHSLDEEQGDGLPSSSLDNLFEEDACGASLAIRGSTDSAAGGPSGVAYPIETNPSQFGRMRARLDTAVSASDSEALQLSSKRRRDDAVDLSISQVPDRPSKRLRCPRRSGTRNEIEQPNIPRHIDFMDDFVASSRCLSVGKSREQDLDECSSSDTDTDTDVDGNSDAEVDRQTNVHADSQQSQSSMTQRSTFRVSTEPTNEKLLETRAHDGVNGDNKLTRTSSTRTEVLFQREPPFHHNSWQGQGEPARSASVPNLSGPSLRVANSLATKEARKRRTDALDRYMPALRGKCAYHFAATAEIVPDHFPDCPHSTDNGGQYDAFRRAFVFQPFTYCFSCGLPQDRNRNGEAPSCHAGVPYGKHCTYGSFIFRTVFCIWQDVQLREMMRRELGVAESLSSWSMFADWAKRDEREKGKYHNCLETFLWFCDKQQKRNPRLFLRL